MAHLPFESGFEARAVSPFREMGAYEVPASSGARRARWASHGSTAQNAPATGAGVN